MSDEGGNHGNKFHMKLESNDFAHQLIYNVVQGFLATNPTNQDMFAYAIQELLKIFHCKPDTSLFRKNTLSYFVKVTWS